jgi:hypothetical protein
MVMGFPNLTMPSAYILSCGYNIKRPLWYETPFSCFPCVVRKLRDYVNRKGPGMVKRGGLMHDAKLTDLELRLYQPYWLLHQGECDHFIVLTQIR